MFDRIMKWFALGLWNAKMVKDASNKGLISNEETRIILGESAE